jgi:hypothetical protein
VTQTVTERLRDMSANASPIFTLFDAESTPRLTRDHILRLATGVVGAIRIEGFGSAEECSAVMTALDDEELGSYDETVVFPRIAKLGPAAYDFYGVGTLSDDYWAAAQQADERRARLLGGQDPMPLVIERLTAAWDGPVAPATCGGRPLFAGMVRETTQGMKMHFDEIARELPGALDEQPVAQLGFNWFVSAPVGGGETVVYRRTWRPNDEGHRDGYGWHESMVADEPRVEVRPELGDAILFDPRNYHAVRTNVGGGRRVSLSFFVGVTASGTLRYWS